jgi:hypothetical protein
MHHHLDPLWRNAEEPTGLDDLEHLVHERRGVDGDLGTHIPVRMSESLRHRRSRQALRRPGAQGPAGGGQNQPLHVLGPLALEGLEDRAVLAVDREQAHALVPDFPQHQRARHHHHLLVGEGDVAAGADRREGRTQPHCSHQPRHHQLRRLGGDGLDPFLAHTNLNVPGADPVSQLHRSGLVGDGYAGRPEAPHLLRQLRDVSPGSEGHHLEALRKRLHHGEGLHADAPGASQQADALHGAFPPSPRTWLLIRP